MDATIKVACSFCFHEYETHPLTSFNATGACPSCGEAINIRSGEPAEKCGGASKTIAELSVPKTVKKKTHPLVSILYGLAVLSIVGGIILGNGSAYFIASGLVGAIFFWAFAVIIKSVTSKIN